MSALPPDPPEVPDATGPVEEFIGEIIDGGHVGELEQVPFEAEKHRAETARRIAFFLVVALVGTWLIHYAACVFLLWRGHAEVAKGLSDDFKTWLPVISGLAGSAVTYYFTKEK